MNKKESTLSYIINLSFYLYFIILIVERSISVISSFINGINIFSNGFYGFTYMLVFLSIVSFFIYLFIRCRKSFKHLVNLNVEDDFIDLSIASGILLLSGMVHTEYTISVIQFISYGILILGILLKVILNQKESGNKPLLWLSFVYLVCYSMAIPVMYHSSIELHVLFHIIEAIAVFVLVGAFTCLLIMVFKGKDNLFFISHIVIALVLDVPLIILRWNEEINVFVLIFISLSTVLFAIGYIYNKCSKR